MDQLHGLDPKQLLEFFRRHKTEMSCMENLQMFLQQLRDCDLMPEKTYQRLRSMKIKDAIEKALYEELDRVEKGGTNHIKTFWECVFKECMLSHYPTLRQLHKQLTESDSNSGKSLSTDEEDSGASPVKKSRKRRNSLSPPINFESGISDSSAIEGGGNELPVTCGKKSGTLNTNRYDKGEKCISTGKQWFTPPEFERHGRMQHFKNWKLSIKCGNTPLQTLIKKGDLKHSLFNGGHQKAKKSLFPSQGIQGMSIRTEMGWLTPVDFVRTSSQPDSSWSKDILWEGKPFHVLLEQEKLQIHQLNCLCQLCDPEDHENERNDDECCVCKKQDGELVMCDECPSSFHANCHLPYVEDTTLRDGRPWFCTFCTFNIMPWHSSDEALTEEVMSRSISQCMKQCQYLVLYMYKIDDEQIFAKNASLHLKNVAANLQRNKYETVGELVCDIQAILTNLTSCNMEDTELLSMIKELKREFKREFGKVFNIHK